MKLVTPALLVLLALAALLTGCASRPQPTSPGLSYADGFGGLLDLSGDAESPAQVNTTGAASGFTIPAGTPVTVTPAGEVSFTAAAPIRVYSLSRSAAVTGPSAFAPPAPPTPTDEAAGRASLFMRLGLVAGVAAAAFGLVRGWDWVAYGGGAIAIACVVGLSLAAVPPWLWTLFGIGAAACVIGPTIWHTKIKPKAFAAQA